MAVLNAAGVDPVESLRGKNLNTTVGVAAADGYRVVSALAELDPTLGNKQVLLVDRENGQPLRATDGLWRLVVSSDQRPARWVRQVTSIVRYPSPDPHEALTVQSRRNRTATALDALRVSGYKGAWCWI